jgi:hypothetical protein
MIHPDLIEPPPQSKKNYLLRILLWAVGILAIILIILSAGINLYLAPYLKKKLESGVREVSGGLYVLKMENLKVRFWRGQVMAGGVVLTQDTTVYRRLLREGAEVGHSQFTFSAPVITVGNIRWREYFSRDVVRVGEIYVDYPKLQLDRDDTHPRRGKPADQRSSPADTVQGSLLERLPELAGKMAKGGVVIDTFAIQGGTLRLRLKGSEGTTVHNAEKITFSMRDIRLDSTSKKEAWNRTLFAADVRFGLQNYRFRASDGIYGLTARRIDCPDPYTLTIDSLDLRTLITDTEFARRKKFSRDRYAVFIPRISCRELDLERFWRKDYVADRIELIRPVINVYRDKRPPRDPSPRRMPNDVVRKLSFYLKMDTIECSDAKLIYSELGEGASRAGAIELEDTHLTLLNLTNDPKSMSAETPAVVEGSTRLMGRGRLQLTLTINLLSEAFDCRYSGNLSEMQASHFNRFFEPSENMRIESGVVDQVVFAVNVRNGQATGHLKALYHDLKVAMLHPEKKKKRKLLSMLGNLLIKSKNEKTEKKGAEIGEIRYQRLSDDGFVRLLWRSVKTGLITTLTPDALANSSLVNKTKAADKK